MKRMQLNKAAFIDSETNAIIEEELAKIKADGEVYSFIQENLKLSGKEARLYLAHLMDYRDDVHYCENCPGLERCAKSHPRFRLRLEREDGIITRKYAPCEKAISLASFRERYLRCSFPEEWRDLSFANMSKREISRKKAIPVLLSAMEDGASRWPYLLGNRGSGRSYMLAALANNITKKSGTRPGAFCDSASLFNELQGLSIKQKARFAEAMDQLMNCSILVLDDFGNEFVSEYVYSTMIFPLLSYRDNKGLMTAFSSDFSIKEVVELYRPKIGPARAKQLEMLLKGRTVAELDVTSVPVH